MPIIVKLNGGLCNQIFQYAFARAVSHQNKTDFRLDISAFGNYYHYDPYGLSPFNIQEKLAKDSDMAGFVWIRKHARFFDFIYHKLRFKHVLKHWYYLEKGMLYDPEVFSSRASYFEGFWQTEKYFKNISEEIRKEITLKSPLSPHSIKMQSLIENSNAISLHVRRYQHENLKPWHGFCTPEYYLEAIKIIAQKTTAPHFFIFTDDYEWLETNLIDKLRSTGYPFTSIGKNPNYEDLMLMAKCRHHILANSSFSWWGAWLNPRRDKIVIAPKQWFAHAPKNNTRDLLPDGWLKI